MSDLHKIIDHGEQILAGSYGLIDAHREFESLKYDILEYFQELMDSYGRDLQSPENLEQVLQELKTLLPPEE